MAGPGETIESAWPPLAVRLCEVVVNINLVNASLVNSNIFVGLGESTSWKNAENFLAKLKAQSAKTQGRRAWGGHGLPKVSPVPALPDPSTPCE
jgi:hypothetical protein